MKDIVLTTKQELEELIQNSIRKVLKEEPKPSDDNEKPFNLKQTCEFLNLKAQTLYGLTSTRAIPFFKKGKKLYFRKSELVQWLNEGRKQTRQEIESELDKMDKRQNTSMY